MTAFVRETWELWYWALFCPTKLTERLGRWVPAPAPRPEEQARSEDAPTGETPAANPFSRVLWLETEERSKGDRLLAQFAILTALSSLPFVASVLAVGVPIHLLLVGATWLAAFGAGVFYLPLGLVLPLVLTIAYLVSPAMGALGLEQVLRQPVGHIGRALCVGAVAAGVTVPIVEALWRRDRVVLGRIVLLGGTWFGFVLAFWSASGRDTTGALVVGALMVFGLGISVADDRHRGKSTTVFSGVVAVVIAFFVAPSLAGKFEPPVPSTIANGAILSSLMMLGLGSGGFVCRLFVRAGSGGVAGAVIGAVAGGFTAAAMLPLVAGLLGALATGPLVWTLLVAFLLGFALAPIRAGNIEIKDFVKANLEGDWREIRHLPFMLGFFPPTRALFAVLIWLLALRLFHGWTAVLIVPAVLAGYFRIVPEYVALSLYAMMRGRLVRRSHPPDAVAWARSLPPYVGELTCLAVPGHGGVLASAFRANPGAALSILRDMLEVHRTSALLHTLSGAIEPILEASADLAPATRYGLVAKRLQATDDLSDLVRMGRSPRLELLMLLPECFEDAGGSADLADEGSEVERAGRAAVGEVFRELRRIAVEAGNASDQAHPFLQERGLQHCLTTVDVLWRRLPAAGLPVDASTGFREALERWKAILQDALSAQTALAVKESIAQPFQSGNPIRDRIHLFKGRTQLATDLVRQLLAPGHPTVVLHGPRRCGKSSFLLNLSRLVPDNLVPVYVDLQSQALTSSEGDFCFGLVRAAVRDLRKAGQDLPIAERAAFRANPYASLEDWLDGSREALGGRRILFCMDEFERLGAAIERGTLTTALLDELRHLIQHREELSFIFCGAQTLEELGPNWTSYFINARPIEILYLEPEDARELLTNPDPGFDLRYDEEVIDRVVDVTACQPYLLQLIGEEMVKVANRNGVRRISTPLLEEAFEGAFISGEIYFANIFDETTGTTPEEVAAGRAILRSLADGAVLGTLDGTGSRALTRLRRYHVLGGQAELHIEIPLLAQWIRRRMA